MPMCVCVHVCEYVYVCLWIESMCLWRTEDSIKYHSLGIIHHLFFVRYIFFCLELNNSLFRLI